MNISRLPRYIFITPQKKLEINPWLQLFMKFQKLLRLPYIYKVVFIKPDHSASFRLYVFDAKNQAFYIVQAYFRIEILISKHEIRILNEYLLLSKFEQIVFIHVRYWPQITQICHYFVKLGFFKVSHCYFQSSNGFFEPVGKFSGQDGRATVPFLALILPECDVFTGGSVYSGIFCLREKSTFILLCEIFKLLVDFPLLLIQLLVFLILLIKIHLSLVELLKALGQFSRGPLWALVRLKRPYFQISYLTLGFEDAESFFLLHTRFILLE